MVVWVQVIMLMYAEEVVLGDVDSPVPPARFKRLEDYDDVEWFQWLAEEEVEVVCLLPCRITLEETKVWIARGRVPCDPYWLDPH